MISRLNTLRELASTLETRRGKASGLATRARERVKETAQNVAYTLQQTTDNSMAEWVAAIRENRATPARLELEAAPSLGNIPNPPSRPVDAPPPTVAGGPIPAAALSLVESLVRTESGGNLSAYNDIEGFGGHVGHGGRLQFGGARLGEAAEAGVIEPMTALEFSQQPLEVQQAVENWHFEDLNRYLDRNELDRFIGTEIAGVPITRDGILAMMHLGGAYGARQFLESGGDYNPGDAFQTSLLDYARTHQ